MQGNRKIFVSHTHQDITECLQLTTALAAWEVDFWFDTEKLIAGHDLSQKIQEAIRERDIFIRVCTSNSQNSYWVNLETSAFRGLQADDHRHGFSDKRQLINLILDPNYKHEPFNYGTLFIDATNKPLSSWLGELRHALDLTNVGFIHDQDIDSNHIFLQQRELLQINDSLVQSGIIGIEEKHSLSAMKTKIDQCNEQIIILDTWIDRNLSYMKENFENASQRGVQIRMLLLDPRIEFARQRSLDLAIGDKEYVPRTIKENARTLNKWQQNDGIKSLEARFYRSLPSIALIIYDNNAYWGSYFHGATSRDGIHILVQIRKDEKYTKVGEWLDKEYRNLWQSSIPIPARI